MQLKIRSLARYIRFSGTDRRSEDGPRGASKKQSSRNISKDRALARAGGLKTAGRKRERNEKPRERKRERGEKFGMRLFGTRQGRKEPEV